MKTFEPHFDILPKPQHDLWAELSAIPKHFVLYGGTALALRLGHRNSIDFDFFTSESFKPDALLSDISILKGAKVIQNVSTTFSVVVNRGGPVKLSFFGTLPMGRVDEPMVTPDGILKVASLLDLAGTKAAVVAQRAESKDYIDLLALAQNGISLSHALAAATALYGEQYNPILTLKSLAYFGDGDLHKLTQQQKSELIRMATIPCLNLPVIQRISDSIA